MSLKHLSRSCMLLLLFQHASFISAQQVYIPGMNPPTPAYCSMTSTGASPGATPAYHFSEFSYTQTETTRTATSNPSLPLTIFAKHYSDVSTLLGNLSSRTWLNWTPFGLAATDGADPYGDAAYSSLWNAAAPQSFSRGLYSTTVSPTPIPSSELVFPPPPVFPPYNCYKFPKDFVFGIAGSASQCEGAVADHGKAPAITDMLGNLISLLGIEGVNNYVTNEHYYLYQQDIERFAAIGAKYYYFTIPWTRIMPFAMPGTPVNSEAIQHYSDMIDFVLSKGMKPVIALIHFDSPLQFLGGGAGYINASVSEREYYGFGVGLNDGYQNPAFQDAFVNYAKIVLSHYADRVPYWVSFNEPQAGAINGKAVDTVIKSHARIVHFYREQLNGTGQFTMKMAIPPSIPLKPEDPAYVQTAKTFNDLYIGAFLNPLALGLDYPDAFKQAIQDYVPLNSTELQYLNGTIDFVAQDSYGPVFVEPATDDFKSCAMNNATSNPLYRFPICINQTRVTVNGWSGGWSPAGSDQNVIAPSYLRTAVNYLWNTWKKPVLISEFGLQTPTVPNGDKLIDNVFNVPQTMFIWGYLDQILKAIWEDGVDVMGALIWNWGDDWEFVEYDTGFGVIAINHTTQERTYRRSFFDAIDFVESRRAR